MYTSCWTLSSVPLSFLSKHGHCQCIYWHIVLRLSAIQHVEKVSKVVLLQCHIKTVIIIPVLVRIFPLRTVLFRGFARTPSRVRLRGCDWSKNRFLLPKLYLPTPSPPPPSLPILCSLCWLTRAHWDNPSTHASFKDGDLFQKSGQGHQQDSIISLQRFR